MTQNELYHYGVLGMKWGHRKQEPRTGYIDRGNAAHKKYTAAKTRYKNVKKNGGDIEAAKARYKAVKKETSYDRKRRYTNIDRQVDKGTYGKRGQARIENRIDKGNSRSVAYGREMARQLTMGTVGTYAIADLMMGGAMSKRAFMNAGKKFADSYAKRKARKSITKIAMNPYFDPIDVAYKVIT